MCKCEKCHAAVCKFCGKATCTPASPECLEAKVEALQQQVEELKAKQPTVITIPAPYPIPQPYVVPQPVIPWPYTRPRWQPAEWICQGIDGTAPTFTGTLHTFSAQGAISQ